MNALVTPALPALPIATLDLRDFRGADPDKRARFVKGLGDSFEAIGFAAIRGHDLEGPLQQQLFEQVQAYFALPEDIKATYAVPGSQGQRGHSAHGAEKAKDGARPDLKEFWHHGQSPEAVDTPLPHVMPNVEVAQLPAFTPTLERVFRALENTGIDLLRAIALHLGLAENFFDAHVRGGASILRAIHYPPILEEPEHAVRAAAHEDINLITLLMGASASGLEVLTRQGQWLPITTPEGYMTINVGDMLQRLTNRRLVSTTHRVVNPPREVWHLPRFSVPFFLHPRSDMDLSCLSSCVSEAHPKAFEDITAGQYLQERLDEILTRKARA